MGNMESIRKPLTPKDFQVPHRIEFGGGYFAVPISTKEVVEDWLVLHENVDMIVQLRGGGSRQEWPYVCTLEENFKDLAWLEICANYKQLFSYVIRRKTDSAYAGCVYIYPIELFYPEFAQQYDVDFSFWITKKVYDDGAYELIFRNLLEWLVNEWNFSKNRIYLRNREIPESLKQSV